MSGLLEVSGLTVRTAATRHRPSVALIEDVELTVAPGELVCLVGESGSGKSVTGRALLGLAREQGLGVSGTVTLDDSNLLDLPARSVRRLRGRRMALIPQEPSSALDPLFRVRDQVAEAVRHATGAGHRAARERAVELLARVRIPDAERRGNAFPHELSGGLCQRVAVAMALAGEPGLIIADEPTSALDATVQLHILGLLDGVRRDYGTGMLLITHDIGVAARADRIVVMYAGHVVEQGPSADVLGDPRHPYTRGLIAAVPTITAGGRAHRLTAMPGGVPTPGSAVAGCRFRPRCPLAGEQCEQPQPLLQLGGGRDAACWRAGVPGREAVPVATAEEQR